MTEHPHHDVRTCLWFNTEGEEAARLYTSIVPHSRIESVSRPDREERMAIIQLSLGGTPFMILNAGADMPRFPHSEAASIHVVTPDQAGTDALWEALVRDGGREGQCGWLTDRFGVSWQIVPEALPRLMSSGDAAARLRVFEAMMKMKKIVAADLERAFAGG